MATETTGRKEQFRPTTVAIGVLVVGHIGLLVVFPSGPALPALAAIEAGALVILVGAELSSGQSMLSALRLGVVYAALVTGVWLLVRALESLVVTTGLSIVGVTLVAYAIHRYELVALGLVENR